MNWLRNKAYLSLRGRLLLFLLGPLLIVLLLSIGGDYRNAINPTSDTYDRALATAAVALAVLAENNNGQQRTTLPASVEMLLRTTPYDNVGYAIMDGERHLLAGDKELAGKSANDDSPANPVFHDEMLHGTPVRTATYRTHTSGLNVVVVVAESIQKRKQAASRIVAAIVWSNLLLISVTMLTVFFGVRLALVPLVGLGDLISQRRPSDLQPISNTGVPLEAHPLVNAINQLILNLHEAHKAQQSFLTTAAHQLRTPIAGLQTQLELITQQIPPELRPRMEQLLHATRRLGHFTHQMLSLARSSPEADLVYEFSTVNLADLCEEAASEFLNAALAKRIDLGFETAKAEVSGSTWLLRELLANLLDNAITYSPIGSRVTCRCGINAENHAFLEVEDDGPGIPEVAREKIFDRFFRMENFSKSGTGLGLAIVKEVAERHHASVSIETPASRRGVSFKVIFSG